MSKVSDTIQKYRDGQISYDEMAARLKEESSTRGSPDDVSTAAGRDRAHNVVPWLFLLAYDGLLAAAAVFIVMSGDSGYFGPIAFLASFFLVVAVSGLPFQVSVSALARRRYREAALRSLLAVPGIIIWPVFLGYVEWAQHRYCSYPGKYPDCPDPGLPDLHIAFFIYALDAVIALLLFPLYIWFVHRRL